jgi:Ca-activated chloride channel family protein
MRQWQSGFLALLWAITAALAFRAVPLAQEPIRPTFRSSVAVVPITAVVRDSRNRVVRDLARDDFQVLEQGSPRRIVQFSAEQDGPVSVAFLIDTSGSMAIASNLAKGREVVSQLLSRMHLPQDEAALYTFHRSLREEVPFTRDRSEVQRALAGVRPWGLTSLYDAVAETARRLTRRAAVRRAVVVVSDGVDTSSELTAGEVARLASSIDVPVYVVVVASQADNTLRSPAAAPDTMTGGLFDVAHMTGGDVFYVSAFNPAETIDHLLATMRHQYFLAIESSSAEGWHALEVKTRRKGLTVRARRAYFSEPATN